MTGSKRPSDDGRKRGVAQARSVPSLVGGSMGRTPTLEEQVGWSFNAVLTGLTFRFRDDLWTAIVKADFPDGPMVSFLDVGSFGRCVEVLAEFAGKGLLTWHRDKYPPRTRSPRRLPQ